MNWKEQHVTLERALEKVDEARFFLARMEDHGGNWPEFGYYLSAFLSAFRSIHYRLCCLGAGDRVKCLSDSDKEVNFLIQARDAEVHKEGVGIVLTVASAGPWAHSPWGPSPWRASPWRASPWDDDDPENVRKLWKFKEGYKDVVNLGRHCLQVTEALVQRISAEGSAGG